jgi:hypothetical protein
MEPRNRSSGWSYAKRSGHAYERLFAEELLGKKRPVFDAWLAYCSTIGLDGRVAGVDPAYGGHAVPSILGDNTIPKGDVWVELAGGQSIRVSVKKPEAGGGQAWLATLDRFLKAMVILTGQNVPDEAVWALKAFTGSTGGMAISAFAPAATFSSALIRGEIAEASQNRLHAATISISYRDAWRIFAAWFNGHLPLITDIAFRRGLAARTMDFADVLYSGATNRFHRLDQVIASVAGTSIGLRSTGRFAGSVIVLPWGFLQAHRPGRNYGPYQLQFHYEMGLIEELLAHASA